MWFLKKSLMESSTSPKETQWLVINNIHRPISQICVLFILTTQHWLDGGLGPGQMKRLDWSQTIGFGSLSFVSFNPLTWKPSVFVYQFQQPATTEQKKNQTVTASSFLVLYFFEVFEVTNKAARYVDLHEICMFLCLRVRAHFLPGQSHFPLLVTATW